MLKLITPKVPNSGGLNENTPTGLSFERLVPLAVVLKQCVTELAPLASCSWFKMQALFLLFQPLHLLPLPHHRGL